MSHDDSPAAGTATLPADPSRDVALIDPTRLPSRPWPGIPDARQPGFQAVIRQSVVNEIHRHGRSVRGEEICGVLVGDVYRDAAGPYLYVEASIRGNYAPGETTAVTFTADTWADIQAVMDQRYPDKKILGWYHTHPGFGIFLSGMDLFVHEHFFGLPWQVALVFDPVRDEEGLFVWRAGRTELESPVIDPDAPAEDPAAPVAPERQQQGGPAAEPSDALLTRLGAVERRQRLTLALVALFGVLALAWPLVVFVYLPALQNRLGTSTHVIPTPTGVPHAAQ